MSINISKTDVDKINWLTPPTVADAIRKGAEIINVLDEIGYSVDDVECEDNGQFTIKGRDLGLFKSTIYIQVVKYSHSLLKTQYVIAAFKPKFQTQKTGTCLKTVLSSVLEELAK